MTSTSLQPPGVRTRSSIGVPTCLPWMLIKATGGHLAVVGVEELEPVGPGQARAIHPEEPFGGIVRPDQPGRGIDDDNGIGKPNSHVEQASRFDHQDSIGCGGPRP